MELITNDSCTNLCFCTLILLQGFKLLSIIFNLFFEFIHFSLMPCTLLKHDQNLHIKMQQMILRSSSSHRRDWKFPGEGGHLKDQRGQIFIRRPTRVTRVSSDSSSTHFFFLHFIFLGHLADGQIKRPSCYNDVNTSGSTECCK